jgi:hypothetical protein
MTDEGHDNINERIRTSPDGSCVHLHGASVVDGPVLSAALRRRVTVEMNGWTLQVKGDLELPVPEDA